MEDPWGKDSSPHFFFSFINWLFLFNSPPLFTTSFSLFFFSYSCFSVLSLFFSPSSSSSFSSSLLTSSTTTSYSLFSLLKSPTNVHFLCSNGLVLLHRISLSIGDKRPTFMLYHLGLLD